MLRWDNSVEIIHCDMRELSSMFADKLKPDLVVSELLGSFGDNELCPECLDGLSDFINEKTICIPEYYCNYLGK